MCVEMERWFGDYTKVTNLLCLAMPTLILPAEARQCLQHRGPKEPQ